MRLDGKVAVVTGASSGIGRAIAIGCAREGADLAITYRGNEAGAEDTAGAIRRAGAPRGGAAGRHQPGRGRRARSPPTSARALRPGRRVDQQRRRRHPDRARAGACRARQKLDLRARGRSARDDPRVLGGGGADAGAGRRHRQHVVGSRRPRHGGREPDPLFGGQGRDRELQQVARPRRSRRAIRVNILAPGFIETAFGEQADERWRRERRASERRSAAGARPRMWPARRSSSPPTSRDSSPAR